MRRRRVIQGISLGAAAALSGRRLRAETPGIIAPEIRIGSTNALSGPASANGVMALTQAAYLRMVNEQGGIAGRQINFIFYDDAYSPPKAVEMVRRLVESDHVGFLFGTLGTPSNSAIARYCNHNKVPQLFISTGADKFADYQQYPWTVGFNPSARTEAQIYAKYVRKALAEPRVAVLYQNDDFGKDYLAGMTEGRDDGTSTLLAGSASYEVTDPTIDSQIFALQASGANVLLSAATPKAAFQAIQRTAEIGWKPLHCVATTSTSVNTTLKPAGPDHATGVISAAYMKDATDPRWGKDPAMAQWREFMDRYMPGVDQADEHTARAYAMAFLMRSVLEQCGQDFSCQNVLKQALALNGLTVPMFLPGITASTSPTNHEPINAMQLTRFNGQSWEPFGDVIQSSDV